jgi:hypothetical protein
VSASLRSVLLYAACTVAIVGIVAWLLTLGFRGAGDAAAIRTSALVAVVVQVAAFAVTKLMAATNMMAAWGAGALVRFVTLVVYALLAVKVLGLPPAAALLSIAVFFFLSTLLEPLFLRP